MEAAFAFNFQGERAWPNSGRLTFRDALVRVCPTYALGTIYVGCFNETRRCQKEGCPKSALSSGTFHWRKAHGGRPCQQEGCTKAARAGARLAHDGGSTAGFHCRRRPSAAKATIRCCRQRTS